MTKTNKELDAFAIKYKLCRSDQEIIFNEEKKLYIVSAGLWDIDPTPRANHDNYHDYIKESLDSIPDCLLEEMLEHDDSRFEYDKLKEIADKDHDWRNMLYTDEDWISGSVYLTEKQVEELEDDFYLENMEVLFEGVKTELAEEK